MVDLAAYRARVSTPEPCDDEACTACCARATLEMVKHTAPSALTPGRLHNELFTKLIESSARRHDAYATMMELVHVLVAFSAHTNTELMVPAHALYWAAERRKGHACTKRPLRTVEERGGWD